MIYYYSILFSQSIIDSILFSTAVWMVCYALERIISKWGVKPYSSFLILTINYFSILFIFFCWLSSVFSIFFSQEKPRFIAEALLRGDAANGDAYQSQGSLAAAYFILSLYGVLFVYNNIRFIQEIINVKKLVSLSAAPSGRLPYSLNMAIRKGLARAGLSRAPSLRYIKEKAGPFALAMTRSMIIYPIALVNHLTPAEVSSIILHELAHIRHYDFYINMGMRVIKTIMSFNPWINLFIKNLRIYQEINCDLKVLRHHRRKTYLSALLKIADYQQPQLAANAQSVLYARIDYLYGNRAFRPQKKSLILPISFVIASIAISFSNILQTASPLKTPPHSPIIIARHSPASDVHTSLLQSIVASESKAFSPQPPTSAAGDILSPKKKDSQKKKSQAKNDVESLVPYEEVLVMSAPRTIENILVLVRQSAISEKDAALLKQFIIRSLTWAILGDQSAKTFPIKRYVDADEFFHIEENDYIERAPLAAAVEETINRIDDPQRLLRLAKEIQKEALRFYMDRQKRMAQEDKIFYEAF